ncbi:MAG: PQQ-dependent sugar dehydrogenase, partial [Acidobacteriota bacterium]|nr:PQQ-dependent sugar dehydrogenase [Acidobacteriota bacterium]
MKDSFPWRCAVWYYLLALSVAVSTGLIIPSTAAASDPPADLALITYKSGFTRPIAVRHAGDGSGRLFVVEQGGTIRVVENGAIVDPPFLDLSTVVDTGGNEQGLLGLAFHPDYANNGFFYVNYTY